MFDNEVQNKTLNWLLESDNIAIKYRTLTEICESPNQEEIDKLLESIWEHKTIQRMLKKQDENGLWSEKDYDGFTSLRYLTAFAEFGLQKDKRIDNYVDNLVISMQSGVESGAIFGCAAPLTLRALVMMGYGERDDIKEIINAVAGSQLYDGGFNCKRLLDKRPERKSCYKADVANLLLYAECKRKNIIINNTNQLVEYFIKRDVFYTSDKTRFILDGRPGWRFIDNFFPVEPMRIGLPLTMSALSILGVGNHPALQKAWEFLNEKTDENGKLVLEGTLTKQPCSFGKVGQPNKWVSFYALLAEKYSKIK